MNSASSQLIDLLARKEGACFDRKSIMIEPKALAIPLVAMANADGGSILIGIRDNGEVEGIADEAFYRVGDKSKKLSFEERMQLMYDKGDRFYEDTPVAGATCDDLDVNRVKAYAKRIGYSKSPVHYLRENHGFVFQHKGEEQVSVAAVLLFSKDPQRFFPRARVRFIRYEGVMEKTGTSMNVIKDAFMLRCTVTGHAENQAGGGVDKHTLPSDATTVGGLGDGLGDSTQTRILHLLRRNPKTSIAKLAATMKVSTTTVEKTLARMKEKNTIRRVGNRKTGHWEIQS